MIEIKKLELQKMKIQTGIMENEFKIMEKLEDIKRLEDNIKSQKQAIIETDERISELHGE